MPTKDDELAALRARVAQLEAQLDERARVFVPSIEAPEPKWVNVKRACGLLTTLHHSEPEHRTVKRWAVRDGFGFRPAGSQWRFDENRILLLIEGKPFEPLERCGETG